jgi:hypothetical protein
VGSPNDDGLDHHIEPARINSPITTTAASLTRKAGGCKHHSDRLDALLDKDALARHLAELLDTLPVGRSDEDDVRRVVYSLRQLAERAIALVDEIERRQSSGAMPPNGSLPMSRESKPTATVGTSRQAYPFAYPRLARVGVCDG